MQYVGLPAAMRFNLFQLLSFPNPQDLTLLVSRPFTDF